MPIGNLTSQILANIHLNEFDRFAMHQLKPLGYVRYGDDFVLWDKSREIVRLFQQRGEDFLRDQLRLRLNAVNHFVQPTSRKLHFLGLELWPTGYRLDTRMRQRMLARLNDANMASYAALARHHGSMKLRRMIPWQYLDG